MIEKINDYSKELNNDLTSKTSLLNDFEFTDEIAFDQQFEGIPAGIPVGGRQASTIADTINSDGTVDTTKLSGAIPQANLNLADRGWVQTCAFSVTDADTVAWGAGTFTSTDGTAYSIGANNTDVRLTAASLTSPMNAKTYIYLYPGTGTGQSNTEYQCTYTATTAVGAGKVLVAVAQNGTTEATFMVLQGQGGENIDAANIVAGSITANEIAASTITSGKMSVTQLSAIAADLGAITAGSINIGSGNAIITSAGLGTFIGLTSLNMKAYTDFETAGRFILTGDIAPTFGNNGMLVAPGTVAEHYARGLWWITNNVFNNNSTFTCSAFMVDVETGSTGEGVGFVGLGLPTVTGLGMTETNKNYCGFEFKKVDNTVIVIAVQCDGSANMSYSGTLQSLVDDDYIELFLKMNASSIDYYTRKNGGAISAKTTLSTYLPTGSDTNVAFVMSNKGTDHDMKIAFQCAAYEH